jgi:tetratricopeptide (TPR) repeat protein/DNA-binding XRE family transcriptional regulator
VNGSLQPFGMLLRRNRLTAGLTQEELAERTGLSVRAISDMERGITSRPHGSTVSTLAGALGLDESESAELARTGRTRGGRKPGEGATTPPGWPVPRQLPHGLANFVGREVELNTLTGLLNGLGGRSGAIMISAIGGTAGVGKTALAVQWAHQVADRFPDGQLYINLRGFDPSGSQMDPAEAVLAFLDALGAPADAIPALADARVGLYRSMLAGRRLLVVLDNARDTSQVRTLLPGSTGCLALITSRNQLAGLAVSDGAHQLTLDVLGRAEACALLASRLGAERAGREPTAVAQLTELSARLPLALTIAAARAAASATHPLAGLVSELRDVRDRLDGLDGGEPTASIRAAFSWSYRQLSAPAARIFQFLGLHPGPDVTVSAAASLAGIPEREARSLLKRLCQASLLDEHVPGRYAFHDLLRIYAGEQARDQLGRGERLAGLNRMLDHYLHTGFAAAMLLNPQRAPIVLPPAQPSARPEPVMTLVQAMAWFEAEYQVLRNVIDLAANPEAEASSDRHAWQIPWTLTNFSDRRGRWDELAALNRTALVAAERLGDLAGAARAHLNIASASIRLCRYTDALPDLNHSVRLFAETGQPAAQGHGLLAIAEVFARQEKPHQVLDFAERALALFRTIDDVAGEAFALNAVGLAYLKLGRDQDVLTCCAQALQTHRRLGSPIGEADSWEHLGQARTHLGQHAAAIESYEQSLELLSELGDRYNQASVLEQLGCAYEAAGDRDEASRAWRRSLQILEDLRHHDAERVRARLLETEA